MHDLHKFPIPYELKKAVKWLSFFSFFFFFTSTPLVGSFSSGQVKVILIMLQFAVEIKEGGKVTTEHVTHL